MASERSTNESRYHLLADNVSDVIWTAGLDLKITYVSPSVERMRGYTVKEAMTQALEKTLPPDSLKMLKKIIKKAMTMEKLEGNLSGSVTLEQEIIRKDGSLVHVEIKATFLRDREGGPVGIMGVTRDITERKRAEEKESRKNSSVRPRKWRPSESLQAALPTISTIFFSQLSATRR